MSRYTDRLEMMSDDQFRGECKHVCLAVLEVGGRFKMDRWDCWNEANRRSKPELFLEGREEARMEIAARRVGPGKDNLKM